ncbi:MAG: helicase-exonuclease AddAB subunit AddB [Candidatus Improbicoccus devescovinae]|nr:MAG: helicase-exonuclease AddAB subunit AddB [Candidatus Improbicoccus devescovinae]
MLGILNLIFGRSGSGKTTKIRELIEQNISNNNQNIILLVPDQSSFEHEYNLLSFLGEKKFKFINVLKFSRLSDFVYRRIGGKTNKEFIDEGTRNILINIATKNSILDLNLFKKNFNSIEFLEIIYKTIKIYSENGINFSKLSKVSKKTTNTILKNKINDSITIANEYKKIISTKFIDPIDEIDILYDFLKKTDFFSGFIVFIDEFFSFTASQFKILKLMIQRSEVFITFKCDSLIYKNDLFSWQAPIKDTARKLVNIAKKQGFKFDLLSKNTEKLIKSEFLSTTKRFSSSDLKILEANLFEDNLNIYSYQKECPNDIFLYKAASIYDECNFIMCNIKKLIIEKNYSYGDFVIIARKAQNYEHVLENIFDNNDIPYFHDNPESLFYKNLIVFVLSALEVVINYFNSDDIFKCIKSGLTNLNLEEISLIENYCFVYNINGKAWLNDFRFLDKNNNEDLELLDKLRQKIVKPFLNFIKNSQKNKTVENLCKCLYELIIEFDVPKNIKKQIEIFISKNEQKLAEEQARLWDILIKSLEEIRNLLKSEKTNIKRFSEFLTVLFKSKCIAFIPRHLDEVIFTSVERMRLGPKKVAFVIGCSDSEFSLSVESDSIFTNLEIKNLISEGINIGDNFENLCAKEFFFVYSALTSPSEKLFVSWSSGTDEYEGDIIKEIKRIFPLIKTNSFLDFNEKNIWTERQAFEFLSRNLNEKSDFVYFLQKYFNNNEKFSKKMNLIFNMSDKNRFKIKDLTSFKKLIGEKILISSSNINKFYTCKFAYFCEYVIKAKKIEEIKFNSLEHGSLTHFLLEKNLINYLDINNEQKILQIINNSIKNYANRKFGDLKYKSERLKYLIFRQINFIKNLFSDIKYNFDNSKFRPAYKEFEFSVENFLQNGININGKIDRIDISESDNIKYFRVIDYKTGAEGFELLDVLYGINAQIIIYLYIINNFYDNFFLNKVPAGMFYFFTKQSVANFDVYDTKKLNIIKEKINKKNKIRGLILDNSDIKEGMITEFGINKSNKNNCNNKNIFVNEKEFEIIINYSKVLINKMIEDLKSGDFSLNPICKNNKKICEWCEYHTICISTQKRFNIFSKLSENDIIKIMESKIIDIKEPNG